MSDLAIPARPGYHRHWFNDIPGRIDMALVAGFTRCLDEQGDEIRRQVSVGRFGPQYAVALEVPIADWDAARQRLRKAEQ